MNFFTNTRLSILTLLISIVLFSCNKNQDGQILENTFTGTILIDTESDHPVGQFTGVADNGNYVFAWDNQSDQAEAHMEVYNGASGSVQLVITDKKDDIVLDELLLPVEGTDEFTMKTDEGRSGIWTVSLNFINFTGEGDYSITPVE